MSNRHRLPTAQTRICFCQTWVQGQSLSRLTEILLLFRWVRGAMILSLVQNQKSFVSSSVLPTSETFFERLELSRVSQSQWADFINLLYVHF